MDGLARAVGRLLIMAAVLAGVLITCLVAGVGTTIAVALAIVLAGLVGLVGVARRPPAAGAGGRAPRAAAAAAGAATEAGPASAVSAMNPATADPADPEALMPRWRRPSLLEARRADPTRALTRTHTARRFDDRRAEADLRVVRYAIVPLLDRPDEILGIRLADLGSGDEVEVITEHAAFLEVISATGERGWIHRTTVRQPAATYPSAAVQATTREPGEPNVEDALSALLAARGLQ
ncbi:MAG: hypothetical protein FIA92_00445 [Chloroflexi bacterium]|nr:hypothetical protein [Chloroflexota bacterium]